MIRYTRGNRTRDIVGAIFLAAALTLLWVEGGLAIQTPDAVLTGDQAVPAVVVEAPAALEAHG